MAVPSLTTYSAGQASVSADALNTFMRGGALLADLQAFQGLQNMVVYLVGLTFAGDGQGGLFYYNPAWTGTPDNVNTVQPSGVTRGAWVRTDLQAKRSYSISAVANGFSVVASSSVLVLTAGSTVASGSVTFPAAPVNGQTFTLTSTAAVTTLTLVPGGSRIIVGGVATLAANTPLSWLWASSTNSWYRV